MSSFKSIAVAGAIGLFVTAASVSVVAECSSSNSARLDFRDGSFFRSPDGVFFYSLDASWDTVTPPFIGVLSVATGTIGVEDVRYIPQYWFPSDCKGTLRALVIGREAGPGPHLTNHSLVVGPLPATARSAMAVPNP